MKNEQRNPEVKPPDWTSLVREANAGDALALESLIEHCQQPIFNIALRMLKHTKDAEDATQEILIQLVTHLSNFRGESAFLTWAYRVASNHLLNVVARDKQRLQLSFVDLGEKLAQGLRAMDEVEESVVESDLIEEVKRSCTLGMLLCLGPEDRMALVLGELFEVAGDDGAFIMGISPAAYRQRLSRARKTIVAFVSHRCGVVSENAACSCHAQAAIGARKGALNPAHLQYANQQDAASRENAVQALNHTLGQAARTAALLRAHPQYTSRVNYVAAIKSIYSGKAI
jgi:RNA polymerase sigma factor (sigma-70 family)